MGPCHEFMHRSWIHFGTHVLHLVDITSRVVKESITFYTVHGSADIRDRDEGRHTPPFLLCIYPQARAKLRQIGLRLSTFQSDGHIVFMKRILYNYYVTNNFVRLVLARLSCALATSSWCL
jgi:hypothetical protein